jgi:RHS repeat-associated protein
VLRIYLGGGRVVPRLLQLGLWGRLLCFVAAAATALVALGGVAGARPPQTGDFLSPHSLVVDPLTGKTYIGSSGGIDCRVFAIGPAGITRHVAGTGICGSSGDGGHARAADIEPTYHVEVDASYVYLGSNQEVRRVQRTNGTISTFIGSQRWNCLQSGPTARVGVLASQVGVSIGDLVRDPTTGHLFISDDCRKAVFEIDDVTGMILAQYLGTSISVPGKALAIDPAGHIYFAGDPFGCKIYKVIGTSSASLVAGNGSCNEYNGASGPATSIAIGFVQDMVFDSAGNLYVTSPTQLGDERTMKIDTGGTLTTVLGNSPGNGADPGITAGNVLIHDANSLAVDVDDNLYIGAISPEGLVGVVQAPVGPQSRWALLARDRLRVMDVERNGGSNPAVNNCDQACQGDPVNTATGEYWEEASDLAIPGRGPAIDFVRSYGSSNAGVDGPLGFGWRDPYAMRLIEESDGSVTIRQENGSEIWFNPNGSGGFTVAAGQFASLVRNPDGTYLMARRQRERFRFDAAGRLTAVEDLNGYATRLSYDASGRLETITDEAGRTVTLSYDASDRIVSLEDVDGRKVAYGYDVAGDLVSVTDVRGETWTYTYRDHLLLTRTDPNGHLDAGNTYDADGRVTAQEDGAGAVTRFAYDLGLTTTTTSPEGRVTRYFYAGGELLKKVEAPGTRDVATWTYTYDPITRGTTQVIDPRGNRWLATYNTAGLQISTKTPLGHSTASTYDAQGNRLTFRDPVFVTTTWTYDAGGNVLTRSTPIGSQTARSTFEYGDPQHPGDLTRATDPLGKATTFGYDAHGDRTSATDPTGATTTWTYDDVGLLETSVSARGNVAGNDPADYTTRYAHDAAGNLVEQTDPLGHVQSWSFDAAQNQRSVTDEAGKSTAYAYDNADRPTTTTRADATQLHQTYDADGLLTGVTDAAGATTSYTRDPRGRLASVTDPIGRTTTFGYDAAGNLTTVLDPSGATTTNTYDASNRLTGVAYSDRLTPNASFGYNAAGARTSITDQSGTSSLTYDDLGRLTQVNDGLGRTVKYGYDLASRMTSITYPNGLAVSRGFDDAGHLTSARDWLGNITTFAYDADGNATRTTFPSATGMQDARSYDRAGDLVDVTMAQGGTAQESLAYDRDQRGLISEVAQTGLPGTGTLNYAYTDRAELATENSDTYAHDPAGNLTELAAARPLLYDDAGQLLRGPVPPGSTSTDAEFTYNQTGSRTSATPVGGSATTYAYDQARRLTAFTPSGRAATTYAYDGSGLRISKTTGASTTRFIWDRSGSLPLLLSDGTNSYIYGRGDQPIAHITSGGAVRYYHQDALGSTRVLSDGRGATVGTFTYTPYGSLASRTGTETTPLGYTGEYTDAESGLQYLRARYYDPASGQFLTRDPLVDQTGQPYAYADGDPVDNTDPSGQVSMPSWDQVGTRLVGAMDSATFGGTALVRDKLGLNGGLDKCSIDYRAARGVMDLVSIASPIYEIKIFQVAKDGKVLSWLWRQRQRFGRDGGISRIGKEMDGEDTISVMHRVTVDGKTVHQHQTHVGKYGGERQFPNEWVQYSDK